MVHDSHFIAKFVRHKCLAIRFGIRTLWLKHYLAKFSLLTGCLARKQHLSDTVHGVALVEVLVVQFVAESRFANCEFANSFFDFEELQFS